MQMLRLSREQLRSNSCGGDDHICNPGAAAENRRDKPAHLSPGLGAYPELDRGFRFGVAEARERVLNDHTVTSAEGSLGQTTLNWNSNGRAGVFSVWEFS